jgi:hypothetical protein
MRIHQPNFNYYCTSSLYKLVFNSWLIKSLITLLLCAILIQPVSLIYASENEDDASTEAVTEIESTPTPEPVPENESEKIIEETQIDSENVEATKTSETTTDEIKDENITSELVDDEVNQTKVVSQQADIHDESMETLPTDFSNNNLPSTTEEKINSTGTVGMIESDGIFTSTNPTRGDVVSPDQDSTVSLPEDTLVASTTLDSSTTSPSIAINSDDIEEPDLSNVENILEEENFFDQSEAETFSENNQNDNHDNDTAEKTTNILNSETNLSVESTPIQLLTNDNNRHQFADTQCVSVGDGSFYCSKDKDGANVQQKEGVYQEQDSDGDLEIYFNHNGKTLKITDNQFDDGAPYYDALTESIVFHRLINGRYQIFEYDLKSKNETQLTDTSENNMEPAKSGSVIVWQRWVDTNWEIVIIKDGVEKQISKNNYHDVAPTVNGGYVMWHTTSNNGEKLLSVYEIATDNYSLVSDPDGGYVENPRFVLVYDTNFENGDVVTKSFDPETGVVSPVGSQSAPTIPIIPEPESTGETKALIVSGKNTSREYVGEDDLDNQLIGTSTKNNNLSTSSSSISQSVSTSTLNEITPDLNLASTTEEVNDFVLDEFDLVVEPNATSTSDLELENANNFSTSTIDSKVASST